MSLAPGAQFLTPDVQIQINGANAPLTVMTDLLAVTVQEDLSAPSMFTLRLVNWDMNQLKVTWSDSDLFAVGKAVTILMGYVDNLKALLVGEITGLEPEFQADEAPTLVVRGYDRRHRLLRDRQTRSFVQAKDSEIASQIAGAVGLSANVTDTKVTLDYVLQHNQTAWEFLQARAQRIGYEVVVEDKTLYFRPHQNTKAAALTLSREADLLEFRPRLTTLTQADQVAVRSWNPKEKQTLIGQASSSAVTSTMGGASSGPATTAKAFGQAHGDIVDRPIFSQAEADQIAQGQLNELALAYIEGEGLCAGQTALRAGAVIQIDGVGTRFSGLYYVIATTHSYLPEYGYRTTFTVRRNAA